MSDKNKEAIHGPLNQLKQLVQKAGIQLKSREEQKSPSVDIPRKPSPVVSEIPREPSDEDAFADAMGGVDRVAWKHGSSSEPPPARVRSMDQEADDRKLMLEALNEEVPITIPDHPEYIEGWIGVAGKRLLPNLRNGIYSIQGQIDLHGLSQAEAQAAVEEYVVRMSRFRPCCIKIIHGRGINSPADRATLKEGLQRLLSTRKMARYVLAYASAAYRDGGVGAVYVLLSRQ
jgi:DNA-nicking Smr family endonuclease